MGLDHISDRIIWRGGISSSLLQFGANYECLFHPAPP
nr:MAG TPA: hypothetical protein [Caudoviricetes sp.]